jgi:hypothetical protein
MSLRPSHPRRMAVVAVSLVTAAGAAVAIAEAGTGTASAATRPTVVLHNNANGKTMTVRVGEKVDLILSSSYWHVSGSSSWRVLHQDTREYLLPTPSGCPHIPGLGCTPVEVNFTARSAGKAVITASRTSCGEALACSASQRTFKVTVIVKK